MPDKVGAKFLSLTLHPSVPINTIDELTESNVCIAQDELLDHF